MTARAALTPEDQALLASVRKALSDLWADPVFVRHVAMSRSAARAIEQHLSRLNIKNKRATPSRRAGAVTPVSGSPTFTAPCTSQQPTLISGCEGRAADQLDSVERRQGKRTHVSLRMLANDEALFHGETCA
jgi:hypothetical protein